MLTARVVLVAEMATSRGLKDRDAVGVLGKALANQFEFPSRCRDGVPGRMKITAVETIRLKRG